MRARVAKRAGATKDCTGSGYNDSLGQQGERREPNTRNTGDTARIYSKTKQLTHGEMINRIAEGSETEKAPWYSDGRRARVVLV